jgi:alkylhydroperoxidase/carboxymuconolactone decarboxylase family protein YurZ
MAGKKSTVKKAPAKKPVAKKVPARKPAVKASAAKDLKSLEKKIGKVPKFFKELTTKEPEMFNMVMRFEQHIWDDGKLSKKTKKIIAIAIAAALRTSMRSGHRLPALQTSVSRRAKWRRRSALRSFSRACRPTCTAKPSSMT